MTQGPNGMRKMVLYLNKKTLNSSQMTVPATMFI